MSKAWWRELPDPIAAAYELSEQFGMPLFEEGRPAGYAGPASPCTPGVGRLLAALAAAKPGGLIAEMGTACGVGCAWLASGMNDGARLVSAEINPEMAEAAAKLLVEDARIEVRAGDWYAELGPLAPFDLLFADSGVREELLDAERESLADWLKPGGILVMDDLTPSELLPADYQPEADYKRHFAFENPMFHSVEVGISRVSAALICTRVGSR